MSAQHLPLEPWLQKMVNNQVLSVPEASLFQDHGLLAEPGELVPLPPELWDLAQRAWLFEVPILSLMQ